MVGLIKGTDVDADERLEFGFVGIGEFRGLK